MITEQSKFQTDGFLTIPVWLLHIPKITPTDALVWSYYGFRQGQNGHCWPSVSRTAQDLGVCRDTVNNANTRLEAAGLIRALRVHGGKYNTNHYTITYPKSAEEPGANPSDTPKNEGDDDIPKDPTSPGTPGNSGAGNFGYRDEKPGATNESGARNFGTNKNKKKKSNKKAKSNTGAVSSLKNSKEVKKLVDLHIELCPSATDEHRPGLLTKCAELLQQHSSENIEKTMRRFSHTATQGDGWGLILHRIADCQREDREEAFQDNLAKDQRQQPKPSPGSKKLPYYGEQETQDKANELVRQLQRSEAGLKAAASRSGETTPSLGQALDNVPAMRRLHTVNTAAATVSSAAG